MIRVGIILFRFNILPGTWLLQIMPTHLDLSLHYSYALDADQGFPLGG